MTDNKMINKKKKHIQHQAGGAVQQTYEASVGARALARAGKCPQLKGIAHEIMFCDKVNVNPKNIIDGTRAALTKSNTAQMRDVILTNGGKIAGHVQLKDTVSSSGITKTAKQILNGKYNKTAVCGTKETAFKVSKALAKSGRSHQSISSTGISSKTTSRVADKALGKMPTASSLGSAVKSGGVTGAASSAAGSVAAGAAGAAVEAAAGTAIGSAVAGTAVGGFVVAAAPVAIGLGAAFAIGSFVSSLFDN